MIMNLDDKEKFMQRCFELALRGAGAASPNPMVGAVLVHNNKIIGEGYHQKFGGSHAEVNTLNSVSPKNRNLIPESTLFVSLEPCCFHGKTPACTDLIIRTKIPRVIVSVLDDTPQVGGKGIQILKNAGVEVQLGVLSDRGNYIKRIRKTILEKQRPYVVLKYAQTSNGYFAPDNDSQFWITNTYTKRLVHKWRKEINAILIGTKTARIDNPQLTNRFFKGSSPIRVIIDRKLTLPHTLNIFTDEAPTLLVSEQSFLPNAYPENVTLLNLDFSSNFVEQLLQKLLELHNIGTLMIEGGAETLKHFINLGLWDEARILTGSTTLPSGIPSPRISFFPTIETEIHKDGLTVHFNKC